MNNISEFILNAKMIGKEVKIKLKEQRYLYGILSLVVPKTIDSDDVITIVHNSNQIEILGSKIESIELNAWLCIFLMY